MIRYGNIKDGFGSGGGNVVPNQGVPNRRDAFRALLGAIAGAYADTTAMQASLAADRVDGQVVIRLSDYSFWVWKNADATAADATHIKPTDVTNGRFVALATTPASQSLGDLGIQRGTGTLVNGVSAAIAANIAAGSRIVALRKDVATSTALGLLAALPTDRVNGAPGSFKITSQRAATLATETDDQSTFDYIIIV